MTDNKYVIKLNDDDDFDLYVNGILTISATFVGGLLVAIAAREGISIRPNYESESYMLAVIRGEGIDVDAGEW